MKTRRRLNMSENIDKEIEALENDITISEGVGTNMSDDIGKLSDDEKTMIKDIRKANERELKNKYAIELLRKSEQGYASYYQTQMEIEKIMVNILDTNNIIKENSVDILKGSTEQKDRNGKDKTIDTLKIEIMNGKYIINQNIGLLRRNCSNLYNYVGTKMLNSTEVIIDEDSYNKQIEQIIAQLAEIGYALY